MWWFVVPAVLSVSLAWAAERVGTITAAGPIQMRGAPVPGAAAQSLVLMSGDEVVTTTSMAVISFLDTSRVAMEKDTRLTVERSAAGTMVCLAEGSIRYTAPQGSRLLICALGRLIRPEVPSEGTVIIEAPDRVRAVGERGSVQVEEAGSCACGGKPVAWLTRKKAVVLVGAGAGAATAIGIAATRPAELPPRSP